MNLDTVLNKQAMAHTKSKQQVTGFQVKSKSKEAAAAEAEQANDVILAKYNLLFA